MGSTAFSPDDRFVACNTPLECIKVRDISSNNLELMGKAKGRVDATIKISRIYLCRDGRWLAVVPENEARIELWDNLGAFVRVFANKRGVTQIASSWEGTKFAFGTYNGSFGVVNVTSEPSKENTPSRMLESDTGNSWAKLEFSRDDSLLAIVRRLSI